MFPLPEGVLIRKNTGSFSMQDIRGGKYNPAFEILNFSDSFPTFKHNLNPVNLHIYI